jgi:hypothetical protein
MDCLGNKRCRRLQHPGRQAPVGDRTNRMFARDKSAMSRDSWRFAAMHPAPAVGHRAVSARLSGAA